MNLLKIFEFFYNFSILFTASQKKAGKYLDMKSKEKAMFKVTSVKINGAQANTQKFPELKNDAIERECYMQIVKQMAETSNKKVILLLLLGLSKLKI